MELNPLVHTWSLPIEEHFHTLFSLLFVVFSPITASTDSVSARRDQCTQSGSSAMEWQLALVIPIHFSRSTVVFAIRLGVVLFTYRSNVGVIVRFADCFLSASEHIDTTSLERSGDRAWPRSYSNRDILFRQAHAVSELLHNSTHDWIGAGDCLRRSKYMDGSSSVIEVVHDDRTLFVQCLSMASTVVGLRPDELGRPKPQSACSD